MKIAILGTRGVPNHYGGFEQFADFFSVFLAQKGHEVYVYNSHNHPYQEKIYKGVHILHQHDPEDKIGTAGQFLYDLNCILDSRKRKFDVILQLGYTSSSIWHFLLPKKQSVIITNMDGLEWKRTKYSAMVQKVLKYAEKLAVKSSHFLISDSIGIQDYISEKYGRKSEYIAYGSDIFNTPDEEILKEYKLEKNNFNMILARLEPENNIEMILDGIVASETNQTTIVIGNHNTKFGNFLKDKFKKHDNIKFLGAIYNLSHLNSLRYLSEIYFHGHTVGGTNPSLLEAMGSGALIFAHKNKFNQGVLKDNAFYFESADDIKKLVLQVKKSDNLQLVQNNFKAIETEYNWQKINEKYLQFFINCQKRN